MKKTREYGPYKWEIETKPTIEIERSGGKIWAEHKFEIRLISPEGLNDNSQLLLFIAELENLGVFDKEESEYSTFTFSKPGNGITTVPSTPYNPLQPSVLYSDNTIPCQSGITGQGGNG